MAGIAVTYFCRVKTKYIYILSLHKTQIYEPDKYNGFRSFFYCCLVTCYFLMDNIQGRNHQYACLNVFTNRVSITTWKEHIRKECPPCFPIWLIVTEAVCCTHTVHWMQVYNTSNTSSFQNMPCIGVACSPNVGKWRNIWNAVRKPLDAENEMYSAKTGCLPHIQYMVFHLRIIGQAWEHSATHHLPYPCV